MQKVIALLTFSPDISFVFTQTGNSNTPGGPELTATLSHTLYNR